MTRHVIPQHLVQFSTGAASAEVAYRVAAEHGTDGLYLLTADTKVENDDNWRFAREVVEDLDFDFDTHWIVLCDGRTPMEVGRDHRVVPNNRMAVCSRVLKRELLRRWIEENCDPDITTIYLGFHWTELDRHEKSVPHWQPFTIKSPLIDPPYISKPELLATFREVRNIAPPALYTQGFHHANCGGACVRGGQAQWELLLRVNRPLYLDWEAEEEKTRTMLGKNVTILKDRYQRPGKTDTSRPISLRMFRERIDAAPSLFDADDWGACGCTDEPIGADQ